MKLVKLNEDKNYKETNYKMQTRIKYGKNKSKTIDVESTGQLSTTEDGKLILDARIELVPREFKFSPYKLDLRKEYKDSSNKTKDKTYPDFKEAIDVLHDIINDELKGFDIVIYDDFDDIMNDAFDTFASKMTEFEVKE